MKTVGIIAEFNPFHNGHRYLLHSARKQADAEIVIAIMSGSFVQRGAGAVYSKWHRAAAAVRGGADIVLELPVAYTLQSADFFAEGAVKMLCKLRVDAVSFGVESAALDDLMLIVDKMQTPSSSLHEHLKQNISRGMSYSAAFSEALKTVFPDFLMLPNHTLALAYLNAAEKLCFHPAWIPIQRIGAPHDGIGSGAITSAAHIRELLESAPASAKKFLPYPPLPPESNRTLLETLALANLRRITTKELSLISGVTEGLENRLKASASAPTFDAFVEAASTRRYSSARIRRIAYNALLGIDSHLPKSDPAYFRVLSLNSKGRAWLRENKDASPLPFIIKTADAPPSPLLSLDCLATDLWALSAKGSDGKQDYQKSPIIIGEESEAN